MSNSFVKSTLMCYARRELNTCHYTNLKVDVCLYVINLILDWHSFTV
jgi:hypothetical protein